MCVPTQAVTRPSRYQPIATFSLVASAWKSTSTCDARSRSSASTASASANGDRAATRLTMPEMLMTASDLPLLSTIVWPRPGAAFG